MTEKEILESIALTGSADKDKIMSKHLIGENIYHVVNRSSGLPRIQPNVVKKFALILSQPRPLAILNPFQIRCCICKSVISYPTWYYSVKYAVNHFHYFVCFDENSPNKPTTSCYRRD